MLPCRRFLAWAYAVRWRAPRGSDDVAPKRGRCGAQGKARCAVPQLEKDVPVRLNFYRDETSSCSEQVVFGDFGIAKDLPAFKTTPIEFTPDKTGEFTFACGMNMLRGKLIVEQN